MQTHTTFPAFPAAGSASSDWVPADDRGFASEPATLGAMPVASPERVFEALDGRWFSVSGDHWCAEVYGVLQEGGWRWVQLGLHGAREHIITLRTPEAIGIGQLILSLTAWLAGAQLPKGTVSIG